jgi:hypothetical protein
MTLIAEIQAVLERTYRPIGINLEDCVIGPARHHQLALLAASSCPESRGLSSQARTYLRCSGDNLHVGIYYHPSLIAQLEAEDPRESITHRNLQALAAFIEEITHGVHAILSYRSGLRRIQDEAFLCSLETQAKVDTYWTILRFFRLLAGSDAVHQWKEELKIWLFKAEQFDFPSEKLRGRYRKANRIAHNLVERAEELPSRERVALLRQFRRASLANKAKIAGLK